MFRFTLFNGLTCSNNARHGQWPEKGRPPSKKKSPQKTSRKQSENTEHNQKATKNSITVELKLIDISFLDLFGVLESVVLALVDVPPLLTRLQWNSKDLLSWVAPSSFCYCYLCMFGVALQGFHSRHSGKQVFSILVPDLDSAKKREDKQNTEKHPENTEYNQKITKNMGNTIAILKLMDISFLDLFGFLKSRIVLALVDVPPVTHTFCNEIQCLYYQGWHRPPRFGTCAVLGLRFSWTTLWIFGRWILSWHFFGHVACVLIFWWWTFCVVWFLIP